MPSITQTIAQQMLNANTPRKQAAVTRRIFEIAEQAAEAEGKDPVMVIAGFKAYAARLKNRQSNPSSTKR